MPEQISFRDVNRKKFSDDEHSADYLAAAEYKKVRLGSLALYYKDFWKKYCVPYDYITRAYKGVSVVTPDDHPAIEYFRLILQHEGKEFANIIFGEKTSSWWTPLSTASVRYTRRPSWATPHRKSHPKRPRSEPQGVYRSGAGAAFRALRLRRRRFAGGVPDARSHPRASRLTRSDARSLPVPA
jgi:hypothetical protein